MKHIVETVESLQHCTGPAQEWQTLVTLQQRLQPFANVEQFPLDEEIVEHNFLLGTLADENSLPSAKITAVFQSATSLNQFVCYVFNRRFGWSESQRIKSSRRQNEENSRFKTKINDLLDQFLAWLVCSAGVYVYGFVYTPIVLVFDVCYYTMIFLMQIVSNAEIFFYHFRNDYHFRKTTTVLFRNNIT